MAGCAFYFVRGERLGRIYGSVSVYVMLESREILWLIGSIDPLAPSS